MCATEFRNAVNCFGCIFQILRNKSRLAFRYHFSHSATVICDYRRATRHGLNHHQTERFGPIDGKKQCVGIAQKLAFAGIVDLATDYVGQLWLQDVSSWAGLEILPGDLKVNKTRFGAFAPGSSELHAILQERRIDTLIITGTATNVCCESSARDAMMLDYRVIMLSDANATWTDDEHAASLDNFMLFFGDVMTADEVIGRLAGAKSRKSA